MNFPLLRRLPLLAVLLTLGLPSLTHAATFAVPSSAYPTIQSGINAAQSGDTVLVGDGTYIGPGNVDLDFGGTSITVKSVNGATKTIIDCQGSVANPHRGFYFHNGETAAARLDGLAIINGFIDQDNDPSGNGLGGGVYISSASPTITNCVLSNNTVAGGEAFGGGMCVNSGSPTITACTFSGNTAGIRNFRGAAYVFGWGGGLAVMEGAPTVDSCTFSGNMAGGDAGYGGGINFDVLFSVSQSHVTNCVIVGNSAGRGGGIFTYYAYPTLTNCTCSGNTAGEEGGGIAGSSTLTNCVIYGDYVGTTVEEFGPNEGAPSATYSDIQGGYAGTGNINADPLFVNASAGDLHLAAGSACVGAGTPSGAPTTDLDGRTRPSRPSIGAYELGATLNVPSQFPTIQTGINAARPGDTVLVADGTYTGDGNRDLDFKGKNITLKSVSGPTKTVIDCQGTDSNSHRGFFFYSGETVSARIDGVTVQNGKSPSDPGSFNGGGICIENSSPTIVDCILKDNVAHEAGGGISVLHGSPVITNCVFKGNLAFQGGGIYFGYSNSSVVNCTFSGNAVNTYYGPGASLEFSNVSIINCIFWDRLPPVPTNEIDTRNQTTTANISYSDIQGDQNNIKSQFTGPGNIVLDPLFVNAAAGDLHLTPGSPCLRAATPVGAPATDLGGTPRSNPPSMGAYELFTVPQYQIIDLGLLGGLASYGLGVNNAGQVVGYISTGTNDFFFSQERAFVWTNGQVLYPPSLPQGVGSEATVINNSGLVAGLSNTFAGQAPYDAVVWSGGSPPLDLKTLGGSYSRPLSINDKGQVAGLSGVNYFSAEPHAFIWSNGTMTDIDNFGDLYSLATGINNRGQAVGSYYQYATYAFYYDGSKSRDLNDPSVTTDNAGLTYLYSADGINDTGQICGSGENTQYNATFEEAFIWQQGIVQGLGWPAGDTGSHATAINASGQVIGYSHTNGGAAHPFLYINRAIYSMDSLIADHKGFSGLSLSAINDAGEIVGTGTINNESHAFILTPVNQGTTVDQNELHLTSSDSGAGRDVDGIVCDNLSGMDDDDTAKDKLALNLPNFLNATDLTGTVTALGPNTNDTGYVKTLSDGKTYYIPPDEYNENQVPADVAKDITKSATRTVTLKLRFTSNGIQYSVTKPITLARPPVVLIHGINSSPASWAPLTGSVVTRGGTRIPFVTVDHSDVDNGNGPVELAAARLASRIATTLDQVHNRKPVTDDLYNEFEDYVPYRLAERRVDLIGWSYGGLIARWYISPADSSVSRSWYKRNNILLPAVTYGNDVRKLITLGSMWRGVPLCNYLNEATLVPVDNRVSLASAALNPGSQFLADLLTHDGLQLGSVRDVGDVVKVVGSHISVNVPSMDVMAVDSPWLSYLVFHDAFQQTQPNVPKPFADDVAYGSVAGDNNSYSKIFGFDTYTLLDDATNLGLTTPTTFPYLRLEQTPNAGRNYSDGIVPLWSSAIPGSYQIVPTDHSGYPDDQDAQNYLVQWLNNATLPTGKGFMYTNSAGTQTQVRGLNETWNDPSSWNDAKYAVQAVNGKRWKFSPDHLAPYPEYDLYQQSDRTGRINPIALHEVKDIVVDPVTPSSAQITWITATDTDSLLWLWTKDGGGNFIGPTAFLPQGQSNATTKIHKVSATGLAPNTTYYYDLFSRWDAGKSDEIFLSTDANRRGAFTTPQDKPIINVTVAGKPTFVGNLITFSLQVSNTGTSAHGFRITGVTFGTIGFTPLPPGYAWYPFGNPITIATLGPPQTLTQTATKGADTPNLLCSVKYQYYNAAGDLITASKTNLRLR